jgi:formyl-CoA transferase
MSGMVNLTGRAEEHPLHVGFSLADAATGLMGFHAVALALYLRDVVGGKGSFIDLALYESLFRMNECQVALTEKLGHSPSRTGSNHPYGWGVSGPDDPCIRCFKTADDAWVAVLLDPAELSRLARKFGCEASIDAIAGFLQALIGEFTLGMVKAFLADAGLKGAPVQDGRSIARTPYFRKRGDVLHADDDRIGDVEAAAILPRMYDRKDVDIFRRPGLGEDNQQYI